MFYNKVYGLHFLKRSLRGVEGTSVLPWRVYRNPDDFKLEHFPQVPRFLIRSNLTGQLSESVWAQLPRSDAPPEKTTEQMKVMCDAWIDKLYFSNFFRDLEKAPTRAQVNSLHFIIHPVRDRQDYLGHICLKHVSGVPLVMVQNLENANRTWRQPVMPIPLDQDTVVLRQQLSKCGVSLQDASTIVKRLKEAHAAILRNLARRRIGEKYCDFEMSLSLAKDNPTHLEFYDLLFMRKRGKK